MQPDARSPAPTSVSGVPLLPNLVCLPRTLTHRALPRRIPLHTPLKMEELLRLLSLLDTCGTVTETKVPGIPLAVPITRRPDSDTSPAACGVRKHCPQKEHVVSSDTLCTVVFLKDALHHLSNINVVACDACESPICPPTSSHSLVNSLVPPAPSLFVLPQSGTLTTASWPSKAGSSKATEKTACATLWAF